MSTITIAKKLAGKDDVVVLPRREYEALLQLKKLKEFNPTTTQKKALRQAETNLRRGKTVSYHELTKRLGFTN